MLAVNLDLKITLKDNLKNTIDITVPQKDLLIPGEVFGDKDKCFIGIFRSGADQTAWYFGNLFL